MTFENIEKVLDRGDKIELLVDKTDTLRADAFRFKRTTREVKGRMWWRNAKMYVIVCVVLAFVGYCAAAQFCSLTLSECVGMGHHGGGGGGNSTASTAHNSTGGGGGGIGGGSYEQTVGSGGGGGGDGMTPRR